MSDPDFTISYEQQQNLVRKKLDTLALKLLSDKYGKEVEENEMVKSIKMRIDADIVMLKDWENQDSRTQVDNLFHDYKRIMEVLIDEQRKLLKSLNKKENINDDLVRQQLELLDLEEEKLRRHFIVDA